MIEDTLRALLADRNVPQDVAEVVFEGLLDRFAKSEGRPKIAKYAWQSFLLDGFRQAQLAGPRVAELSESVRVARIMSLDTFINYHVAVDRLGLHVTESALRALSNHLTEVPVVGDVTRSRTGVTWTCLDTELRQSHLADIESGLGLYHLSPGTPVVAVTYTIDPSELHVPTVLDAGLEPWFVPKSVDRDGIPRAWDRKQRRWGLSEMVHRSGINTGALEVRFLGTTSHDFSPVYDGLASFEPAHSAALEDLVAQALRQAVAHEDLRPFLDGETSIIEITPIEFEHFLASLYARKGYKTTVTRASRDGGFDIIALSGPRRSAGLLIQAKQTKGTVGIRVIRELVGARFFADNEYSSHMLVVATTGRFSRPARDAEAQHAAHVQLVDYDALQRQLRLIKDSGYVDIVKEAVNQSREIGGLTRQ